jgi:histidinol phosphatase-like enzyme
VPGGRRKPEPGMLLEAMAAAGVHDRASCIFIGDSDTDMQVCVPSCLRAFTNIVLRLSDTVVC